MKTARVSNPNPSVTDRNDKAYAQTRRTLLPFLVFALCFLSVVMIHGSLGRLSKSFTLTDSALAVEFNVGIIPPEAFWLEQGEHIFEYHFLSEADLKGLVFKITNNGKTDVLCKPYINGDLTYRIYVAEQIQTEFVVKANETVDFWLIISPDGLDTHIIDAKLFIDIQQWEGK